MIVHRTLVFYSLDSLLFKSIGVSLDGNPVPRQLGLPRSKEQQVEVEHVFLDMFHY